MSEVVEFAERFCKVVKEYEELLDRISDVDITYKRRLAVHIGLAFKESLIDAGFDCIDLTKLETLPTISGARSPGN